MRMLKASALALALGVLGTSALAAEPARCCCCKDKAEEMSCCDKKAEKPSTEPAAPAQPDAHQQHNH